MSFQSHFRLRFAHKLSLVVGAVFAVSVYVVFFYRIRHEITWTDVKRVLVQENAHDLKEFYEKINDRVEPSKNRNYEDRRYQFFDIERTLSHMSQRNMSEDEAWSKIERESFIKPTFSVRDIRNEFIFGSRYPTIWENFVNIYNDTAVIVIYVTADERIVGWKTTGREINMRP